MRARSSVSPPGRQYSLFQVRTAFNSNVCLPLGMVARIAFAKVVQNFKPKNRYSKIWAKSFAVYVFV